MAPERTSKDEWPAGSVDASPSSRSRAQFLREGTILVVDDEPDILFLLVEILRIHGYSVISAGSGLRGLELARTYPGPIRLLLTDVVMPGMDGQALARQMLVERPDIRVLYMTGDTEAARTPLPAGSTLLRKPFTFEELEKKLGVALA